MIPRPNRLELIESFDEIRASFLAALDQVIVEVRPRLQEVPGYYQKSVLGCAMAFADSELVRKQLFAIAPELKDHLADDDLADAHVAAVSYLFSLALHELMRRREEMPELPTTDPTTPTTPTPKE